MSAASNAKQASAKKAASGINGASRAAFLPTSKAIQSESIEALIFPFSKIIQDGPTLYYCDYVTNVTYKIQCKYPDIRFCKMFCRKSKLKIPMAEILSAFQKGNADS